MKRQSVHQIEPTGSVSVPLFNQKKRNRVPLTSAPPVNESYGLSQYMTDASDAPSYSKAPGGYISYQASTMRAPQSVQPHQYGSSGPAPRAAPTVRHYAPLSHPYKAGNTSSKSEQPNHSVRQREPGPSPNPRFSNYQTPHNNSGQSSYTRFTQMGQQTSYKPLDATYQFSPKSANQRPLAQAATRPTPQAGQQQHKTWNFTNSFGPQPSMFERKKSTKTTAQNVQMKVKPAVKMSLRILTAVIDGVRHWSQFKDKVPYLFEIFATLDSAVTVGPHGAKNFLIRDGKDVLQCVYYENEQQLPRFLRGQVHRCVGNYDRSRNVLVCVSVRPALPSELRNAQEAVKVCDAEMRALVKSFSEV